MLITRIAGASAAIALSSLNAFGQPAQIAAISGRDQLALYDLTTGAELARFETPGGSSDLLRWAAALRCRTILPETPSFSSISKAVRNLVDCLRLRLGACGRFTCI
jgi:hypothetical protein